MSDLPTLYYRGKSGALYQWRIWAEGDTVLTEFGQVGGVLQVTPGKRCEPVNVGKANARSAVEQAQAVAQSMHTFKLERKYRLDPQEAEQALFLPMLATPLDKVKLDNLSFPADLQPKLDGVRCLAYWDQDEIRLMSRSGKPYTVPHIQQFLARLLPENTVLDGELYCHGVPCQTITSLVKRAQAGQTAIQYHVYDIPESDGVDTLVWSDRKQALANILDGFTATASVQMVETKPVASLGEAMAQERQWVEAGYEGAMIRLLDGTYEWGYRSRALLKLKTFEDAEFIVTGAREGEGRMKDRVVWSCQNNDGSGTTFECQMACSMEDRAVYWQMAEQYIGRPLTVKFFGRTADGIPRFPVGKLFRSAEDLP